MRLIRTLLKQLRGLNEYSKLAVRLGAALMLLFYIVGFVSLLTAPYVPNYHNAVTLYHGCLEAAPASLAAGVCAGLLGDLMLHRKDKSKKDD